MAIETILMRVGASSKTAPQWPGQCLRVLGNRIEPRWSVHFG